jgi:PKD repeat protein
MKHSLVSNTRKNPHWVRTLIITAIMLTGVLLLASCGGRGQPTAPPEQPTAAPPSTDSTPTSTPVSLVDAGEEDSGAAPTISLSPDTGAPGTVVSVSGEGWPAQSRVVIYLVPIDPPNYAINSAVADANGQFKVDFFVPSDPRWLNQSPVPVLAELDDGSRSAQAMLNISSPTDETQPSVTPQPDGGGAQPTPTPTIAPPAPGAPGLTVNTTALNVRRGPGVVYDIVGVMLAGQQGEIIGRNNDATWWQIAFPGAREGLGWVSAAYVTAENIANVPIVAPPPPPATPPPPPPPDPGITDWLGEYFNNPNLQGAPVLRRNDVNISFDWGLGSPAPEIPVDNFSARWTRDLDFPEGRYRFYTRTDDGVRLWIDGAMIIDQWRDQSPTTYAADVYLTAGRHNIRMEYYERTLGAVAILSWERIDTYPDWRAEYFNNRDLAGAPVVVRNEVGIDYDWGQGSPAGVIPSDAFSARWSRRVYLDSGSYLFRVRADDGVRIWVDNNLILDQWYDGFKDWMDVRRDIPAGPHDIRVEYYEATSDARISVYFWREGDVTVGPRAVISAPSTGLRGEPIPFDGSRSRRGTYDIVRYEWEFGDGYNSHDKRPNHTYQTADVFRVKLTVVDAIGQRDWTYQFVRVEANPLDNLPPIAIIDGPNTGNTNQVLTFDGRRSQSYRPLVSYQWTTSDGGYGQGAVFDHAFTQPGVYDVRLVVVSENGMRGSTSQQVTINQDIGGGDPPPAIILAPDVALVGESISFQAGLPRTTTIPNSFEWDFGDGHTGNGIDVPHTYDAAGTYNVRLTVVAENGKSATSNKFIQIINPPQPDETPVPSISGPAEAQVGETVNFDGSNTQSANPIDNGGFVWQFGDGTTATGPQAAHAYNAEGSYDVVLTVTDTNGLSGAAQTRINIRPAPQPPQAVISGPDRTQVNKPTTYDAYQSQSSSQVGAIEWDMGDGTTATGPEVTHQYAAPGVYQVTLKLTDADGMEGTATKSVSVEEVTPSNPPVAVIVPPAPVTAGEPISLDGSTSTGDNALVGFQWDFGDGSTGNTPIIEHTYTQAGVYNVTLTVTDIQGLIGSTTAQVQVNPPTKPIFPPPVASINAPADAMVGDTITFDGSGSSAPGAPTFQWDMGDGTQFTGPVVSYAYPNAGTYNVTLTITNEGGSDTASVQVNVLAVVPQPQPTDVPGPRPSPPQAVINGPDQGMTGDNLLFDGSFSQASSPIVGWVWDFGDGTNDTSNSVGVGHVYGAPGTYTVQLTVTDQNGMQSSDSQVVQINPPPAPEPRPMPQPEPQPEPEPQPQPLPPPPPPQAVINGAGSGMVGDELGFDGSLSTASSPIVGWVWDFGDGNRDQGNNMAVRHRYSSPGAFNVTLTVTDQSGQSSSANWVVQIAPPPAPEPRPMPMPEPMPEPEPMPRLPEPEPQPTPEPEPMAPAVAPRIGLPEGESE